MPPAQIRTLLQGLIDYAGLFPPASLDLPAAVTEYAAYRKSDVSWALGRFVAPALRLRELEVSAARHWRDGEPPWRITALAGADLARDLAEIDAFNQRQQDHAVADAIELRADGATAIATALRTLGSRVEPGRVEPFVEIPVADDPTPLIAALAGTGGRAKIRTGGVTPAAFPSPVQVLRFLRACVAANVPFKATAGLHHPLRGAYRLTYQPDSACATMFGFLNIFLAAAFLQHGMDEANGLALLEESSPASLELGEDFVAWRSHRVTGAQLRRARGLALSFGSCSFREPIEDLRAMRLL
jgi:hypothetical protein